MKANKYFYLLAAAALTASACSSDKDQLDEAIGKVVPQEGEAMTFAAKTVDGMEYLGEEDLDGQSSAAKPRKIGVSPSDFSISHWYINDKISISDGTLNYTFSPSEDKEGPACSFSTSGNSFVTDGTGDEGTFYAFYPQEAVLSWNGPTVTTMIWTEQLYSENAEQSGILGPYIAASATTTGGGANASFDFGHICSVIDVDLSSFDGGTIQSVSLLSNSGASLAGRMLYNCSTKAASLVNNDGGGYAAQNCISNLVTVSNVNAATATVRFYVLPITQESGFTITVRTTDGNFFTKRSTTKVGNTAANADYLASMSNQSGSLCLPFYKKYKFGNTSTATKNLWMATIPNNLRLRQLTVPGAHNAATSGVSSSASKCQSETISGLLANGVRGFDLRPRYTSSSGITADNLLICHGLTTTDVLFKDAVADLVNFVKANPSEVIFINMQKEKTSGTDRSAEWRTAVRTIFQGQADYLLPSLEEYQNFGAARGKVVVISKNPYGTEGVYNDIVYGGIIQNWGDNTSTEGAYIYKAGGSNVASASVEDTYDITSTSNKQSLVSTMLGKAANDNSTRFYFTWNNMAYSLLSGNPSDWAATMNPWLTNYVNNAQADRLGLIYADFIGSTSNGGAALLKAIIQHNYKYVYKNRTRNTAAAGGTDTGVDVAGDEYADDSEVFAKQR